MMFSFIGHVQCSDENELTNVALKLRDVPRASVFVDSLSVDISYVSKDASGEKDITKLAEIVESVPHHGMSIISGK